MNTIASSRFSTWFKCILLSGNLIFNVSAYAQIGEFELGVDVGNPKIKGSV